MRIVRLIPRYMVYVAAVVVVCLMMVTVVNVIGRYFFSAPMPAAIELCAYMLALIVGLGLGLSAVERKHIKVDLVMHRLPRRAQFVTDNAMLIVSFIMLGIFTWTNVRAAIRYQYYTSILELPQSPFRWIFSVGLAIFCICTLIMTIENFRKRGKGES